MYSIFLSSNIRNDEKPLLFVGITRLFILFDQNFDGLFRYSFTKVEVNTEEE